MCIAWLLRIYFLWSYLILQRSELGLHMLPPQKKRLHLNPWIHTHLNHCYFSDSSPFKLKLICRCKCVHWGGCTISMHNAVVEQISNIPRSFSTHLFRWLAAEMSVGKRRSPICSRSGTYSSSPIPPKRHQGVTGSRKRSHIHLSEHTFMFSILERLF